MPVPAKYCAKCRLLDDAESCPVFVSQPADHCPTYAPNNPLLLYLEESKETENDIELVSAQCSGNQTLIDLAVSVEEAHTADSHFRWIPALARQLLQEQQRDALVRYLELDAIDPGNNDASFADMDALWWGMTLKHRVALNTSIHAARYSRHGKGD